MTTTTIQSATNEARDKFFSIGKKDRNLFMQLLLGLKYPLHHVLIANDDEGQANFKIYKKAFENGNKKEFVKNPMLYVIKRNEQDDRIGLDWKDKALKLKIEQIVSMFYIVYEDKPLPLQDVLDEFIEDKYPTMKKYCKTSGKNSENFEKHRSGGKSKVRSAKDDSEAYENYWKGYRRHGPRRSLGFELGPVAPEKYTSNIGKPNFVPPDERTVMYVEFNPPPEEHVD